MGFDLYQNRGKLVFEGTRYRGAEVTVRLDLPLGDLLAHDACKTEEERMRWMAEHVIESWNLERDGEAIPMTADALMGMPPVFRRTLHREWMKACLDPDLPFESPSPAGGT